MKRTMFSIAALAALGSASAFAADLPVRMPVKAPPVAYVVPFSWTGFYIGGNVGWGGAGDDRVGFHFDGDFLGDVGNAKPNGIFGGGQIGYNWQTGAWVFGVETDLQFSGLDD